MTLQFIGKPKIQSSVSLITCTLNSEQFLADHLNSVKSQSIPPFEHLFIDGGSQDRTAEILESYTKSVSYPVRVIQQSPSGVSSAMNKGAYVAEGEYLWFLHADDEMLPTVSMAHVMGLLSLQPTWLIGNCFYIDSFGENIGQAPNVPKDIKTLYVSNFVSHPASVVKRETFIELGGFEESLQVAMDYDLSMRLAANCPPLQTNFYLARFRIHDGSISNSKKIRRNWETVSIQMKFSQSPSSLFHALLSFSLEMLYVPVPGLRKIVARLLSSQSKNKR
jgi:glycosyltransferase involved in cell wall biosynthesis